MVSLSSYGPTDRNTNPIEQDPKLLSWAALKP